MLLLGSCHLNDRFHVIKWTYFVSKAWKRRQHELFIVLIVFLCNSSINFAIDQEVFEKLSIRSAVFLLDVDLHEKGLPWCDRFCLISYHHEHFCNSSSAQFSDFSKNLDFFPHSFGCAVKKHGGERSCCVHVHSKSQSKRRKGHQKCCCCMRRNRQQEKRFAQNRCERRRSRSERWVQGPGGPQGTPGGSEIQRRREEETGTRNDRKR